MKEAILTRSGILARLILAMSIVLIGACGPSEQEGWARPDSGFDAELTEKTLVQGFSALADRPLEPVAVPILTVEGMKGLGTIDSSITVQSKNGELLLMATDKVAATYPMPDADDIRGWAKLAVTLTIDAAKTSPMINAADSEQVLEAIFDASLSRLDLFSHYHGAHEARRLRSERNGFGGIGVTFDPDPKAQGIIRVRTVLEHSPAAHAGIKPGDLIARIDGKDVTQMDRDAILERLRGPVGSEVELVMSGGEGHPFIQRSLRRTLIVPPTVTSQLHDDVLDIKITSFNQKTADGIATEVRTANAKLGPLLKGVILDLRGNPGGLLDQAVQAADFFMASGIIVQTRGRHPLSNQSYEASAGELGEKMALVVLIDGHSASAAEILAGALEDSGRAVVIGTNSYGKGTVQTVVHMPNDGEITLTWSRFFTPSGYALHGLGVLPTLCTALVDGAAPTTISDQLRQAETVSHDLADWRKVRIEDADRRSQLRDLCPAEARTDAAQDIALAEKLLSQPALFQQALSLSTPPATSVANRPPDHATN